MQKTKNTVDTFHILTKPRGAICNLDCDYCYFLKKESLYPQSSFRMSADVLENLTRQYIQAQRVPRVVFSWQGGEPTLMGLDFYKKAIELQSKYARPGFSIENALQTNGTVLDDAWCAFFKEHNFLIGISIDGPPELHDVYRKDKGGSPTFHKVLSGLESLKKFDVEFNVVTTVNAANADHPLEVYRFLRDELEAKYFQFIPIVERDNKKGEQKGNKVTSRSVTGKQFGDFYSKIFDEWIERDVGEIFIQLFETALAKWLGRPGGLCVLEETCGLSLALEHNGDLYSCDHFVEPRYRLGNIEKTELIQLVSSHKQRKFGADKLDTLPKYCLDCEVRFVCNGGCTKNRFLHTPEGEYGLNYLCEGYQAFFNHIDDPMKILADLYRAQKPSEEVMNIYRQDR